MKGRITSFLATVVLLAWGSSAYAACTSAQFAGTWDVVFSDGNSCRLVLTKDGDVLTNPDRSLSTCFDPFRGETAPDSGTYDIARTCDAHFSLVIEGLFVEMYGRIAQPRNVSAGFYVILETQEPPSALAKGSFTMIRAN